MQLNMGRLIPFANQSSRYLLQLRNSLRCSICLQHVLGAGPQLSCSNADDSWQQMELDAGDPADNSSQRLHLNVKVVICQAVLQ